MVIRKILNVAGHLHVIQRQSEENEGHDLACKPRPESGTVEFMSDPSARQVCTATTIIQQYLARSFRMISFTNVSLEAK